MSANPDFLFIGPSKAASSWLFERLRDHPKVLVPEAKDIYFFDRNYGRGFDWYREQFGSLDDGFLSRGEICHDYLYSARAASRIAADLPDVKLLFGLRDPIERSISHYRQSIRMGNVTSDIDQALETNPAIIDHSRYSTHLRPYLDRFNADQIFVMPFDLIASDPRRLLCSIFDYLDVPYDEASAKNADQKVNPASRSRFPGGGDLARIGANTLRSLGLENVLGRLKRGPLRTALFTEIDVSDTSETEIWRPVIAELLASEAKETNELLAARGVNQVIDLSTRSDAPS